MALVPMQAAHGEDDGKMSPMAGIVTRLEEDARQRVMQRRIVEDRWIVDMQQYEGIDDRITQQETLGRSDAVVNITRAKCNTFESKLFDMLFPTDDRNWGIAPTPVPELDRRIREDGEAAERMIAEANVAEDDDEAEMLRGQADPIAQEIAELEAVRQRARQQADMMADEIADNLVESDYAIECRHVIHDATVAGTGFLKGPMPLSERVRKNWLRDDKGTWRMAWEDGAGDRFAFQHASFWNVFPDNGARRFQNVESWMERHLMRRRDLRAFARLEGVDTDAVRRLLEEGPSDLLPEYMREIDYAISEEQQALSHENVYAVWEYRGPLDIDEMETLIAAMMQGEEGSETASVEVDPLIGMEAVVWFCQGELLKFGVSHMTPETSLYNVFQIEKSDSRLWGVGIPYLMRTQASIVNDAWRQMMDNAAFGAFPIIELDTAVIQPMGPGEYRISPGDVLERTASAGAAPGLIFHEIPIHQQHYAAIIEMAMQFTDQETNISVLASGEQGAASRTAGGMALLMNSVNVVFRRVVKNFDDGITSAAITKAYHFLMEFGENDEIKGDYTVEARGSSVLLVREVQAQNLLLLASQLSVHPLLGNHFRLRELLKKLLQSMMISADDVLKTTQEIEAEEAEAAAAQENQPPDPEMVKLQLQQEIARMEAETKMAIAQLNLEGDMSKLAAQQQMTLEQVAARLQAIREQSASKERMQAQEAAIEGRRDDMGITRGSGGVF